MTRRAAQYLVLTATLCTLGCHSHKTPEADIEPTTRPTATDVDPNKSSADYWLDQPAVAKVTDTDFDRLFNAAERVARNRFFNIDQADRRAGLLITAPETSKQFFEIWRNDTGTARGTTDSSLSTHRRTIRYEFTRNPDGTFTVTPKVLVERFTTEGRRVTIPALAGSAFDPPAEESDANYRHYPWDPTYWYATGRDTAMEKQIATSIESRIKK